jgi:hypothetical protein
LFRAGVYKPALLLELGEARERGRQREKKRGVFPAREKRVFFVKKARSSAGDALPFSLFPFPSLSLLFLKREKNEGDGKGGGGGA